MANSILGNQVLLLANTGTDASPVWTSVGSQTNVTFTISNDVVDQNSKESRNRQAAYGHKTESASIENLYVPGESAYLALRNAAKNGDKIKVRRQRDGTDTEEALAVVSDISEEMPDRDNATISIDIEIDGEFSTI